MLLRVLRYCYELPRNQWLTPSALQQLQMKRLQAMLRHAYAQVPLYRRKFDAAGIALDDIQTVHDLEKLPFTTKLEIQQGLPNQSVAQNYAPDACVRWGTSGTTGGPMPVYYDKQFFEYLVADRYYRRVRMMGCNPWDRVMRIQFHMPAPAGAPREEMDRPSRGRAALGASAPLFRRRLKTTFIAYSADQLIQDILDYQPKILRGSPSYLRLVAEKVADRGHIDLPLKAAVSRSELLDEPTQQFLESTFGCPVFDEYGAAEVGGIARSCPQSEGLHILGDFMLVEVIRNGTLAAPGQLGDIVVTGLLNKAMPLIRYRVGDVGILGDRACSCGRAFPLLKSVEGRIVDCFTRPDGRVVSPKAIMTAVQGTPGVSRYQVVQERRNSVRIELMQRPNDPDVSIEELIDRCCNVLGDEVEINVVIGRRDNLKAKFRPVISKLTVTAEPRWTQPYQTP